MSTTVYIVPAFSDQAGQCRIVAADGVIDDSRDSYQANPNVWREVGLMNSQGRVTCLDPKFNEMRDDEPLMAGTQWLF